MYWIYLALFVLIVLIPKIINGDRLFLVEDDQESLLIFFGKGAGTLNCGPIGWRTTSVNRMPKTN